MAKQSLLETVNINKPRYDQKSYIGRAKHFFLTANPLNLFVSDTKLEESKKIVEDFRKGKVNSQLTEDELWKAKNLYDSAYHPDTGDKMNLIGRMSFQVPGNMVISGGLLTFYKQWYSVVFWQWLNQSYNAIVNYTNRSGDSQISNERLVTSYFLATTAACASALFINKQVARLPSIVGRMVPFTAVATANCINIPCMRSQEFTQGINVTDESGTVVYGTSSSVAKQAVAQVVVSRVFMAIPGMTVPPIVMNYLEKRGVLARYKYITLPLQVFLCGLMLTFATPLGCALFPQQSSISTHRLESDLQVAIRDKNQGVLPERVYYNKGL